VRVPPVRDDSRMEAAPVIYRTEVRAIMTALADIIVELRKITRLLSDEEEEDPAD
jgi:hypothetical protein